MRSPVTERGIDRSVFAKGFRERLRSSPHACMPSATCPACTSPISMAWRRGSPIGSCSESWDRERPDFGADVGVRSMDDAECLRALQDHVPAEVTPIVALESLPDPGLLEPVLRLLPGAAFSLDLHAGRLRTEVEAWQHKSPVDVVADIVQVGFQRVIVLDVAAVGTQQGCPTADLCRQIHGQFPWVACVTGGGIRRPSDLAALASAGCAAALVGSWLLQMSGLA